MHKLFPFLHLSLYAMTDAKRSFSVFTATVNTKNCITPYRCNASANHWSAISRENLENRSFGD